MSDSTRRALRTAYQVLLACATTIPLLAVVLLGVIPAGSSIGAKAIAVIASAVTGAAVVAKVLNRLEDAGLIPAWLKGDTLTPAPVTPDGTAVITDVPPAATESVDPGPTPPTP